jgi:putative ABC transport system ATP-binding protein
MARAAAPEGLVARGLTKIYRTGQVEIQALRGADFELNPGELVVLLGPSGSGKSTLLNILGGLDTPTAGVVWFRDHNLTQASEHDLTIFRREHVGFVFQFYNLIPSLTARENVALVTEIAAKPMRPEDALTLVGLADRMDHFPAQLSGGEQQRVAIARALVNEPQLVLADEPTGNLDPDLSLEIMNLFREINARGTTVVVATHDRELIRRVGRRTITLEMGRMVEVA